MAGLYISTLRLAMRARLILRINSSVFPENIEPHTTSIQPFLCEVFFKRGSKNMCYCKVMKIVYFFDCFLFYKFVPYWFTDEFTRSSTQTQRRYFSIVRNVPID